MKTNTILLIFLFFLTNFVNGQEYEVLSPSKQGELYGLVNENGEFIVEPQFSYIYGFVNGIAGIRNASFKYGLIDSTGRVILEPIAKEIVSFQSNGLGIVKQAYRIEGVINRKGEIIVPIEYTGIDIVSDHIIVQDSTRRKALLDLKGNMLVDFKYKSFSFHNYSNFDPNLIVVSEGDKSGLIHLQDNSYKTIIRPKYERLAVFNNNHFRARKNDKWGLINRKNKVVIPYKYTRLERHSDLLLALNIFEYEPKIKTYEGDIQNVSSRFPKEYDDENKIIYYHVSQGTQDAWKDSGYDLNQKIERKKNERTLYTAFDSKGQLIISARFDEIRIRDHNLIEVKSEEGVKLYNKNGERSSSDVFYQLDEIREGLMIAKVRSDSSSQKPINRNVLKKNEDITFKYGYVDTNGKIAIPIIYDDAQQFKMGVAPVKQKDKWALVNAKGTVLCDFKYDDMQYVNDNRYAYRQNDLWGLLDLKGKEIIPAKYKCREKEEHEWNYFPLTFEDGLAIIVGSGINNYGKSISLIDTTGVQLFPFEYTQIEVLSQDFFKVKSYTEELDTETYGIIDRNNRIIVPHEQRDIVWVSDEKVFKAKSLYDIYSYYSETGEAIGTDLNKQKKGYSLYYGFNPNGIYVPNYKGKGILYSPSGDILIEGVMKEINDSSSFHEIGEVFEVYYLNGNIMFRRTILDYKRSKNENFYKNGKLMNVTEHLNGRKIGISKDYHENGKVWKIGAYKANSKQGEWKTFYKNGKIASIENYRNNKLHGPWESYYENGNVTLIANYKNGRFTGGRKSYHENGNIEVEVKYPHKDQREYREFFKNGNLKEESIFIKDLLVGEPKRFYENGKIERIAHYENGKIIGEWKHYDLNGDFIPNYKLGEKEGIWREYRENGDLKTIGAFKNYKKEGVWKEYDLVRSLSQVLSYKEGLLDGESTEYSYRGQYAHGSYKENNKDGIWIYYHQNGEIKETGIYKLGLKEDEWKIYNDRGILIEYEYYSNDDLQNSQRTFKEFE